MIKSIKYVELVLYSFVMLISCGKVEHEIVDNQLTEKEIAEGWVLLFDGETFDGWESIDVEIRESS